MPCCGEKICWGCLRGHVSAVMDSLSDEQRDMICPFCAGGRVDGQLVRRAFRRSFRFPGSFFFFFEAKEVRRFETWSVEYALLRKAQSEEVLRCPGLDCANLWLVDRNARRNKRQREPRWLWNPVARAFYSPPVSGSSDARRVYCDSCRKAFCAVCRRPWTQLKKTGLSGTTRWNFNFAADARLAAPTESHDFRSCVAFAGRSLDVDDDFASVAAAAGARHCPNCSLRVARSAGCNHIVCPACATHFCFLCEARWTHAHYACRDEHGVNYAPRGPGRRARRGGGPGDLVVVEHDQNNDCALM